MARALSGTVAGLRAFVVAIKYSVEATRKFYEDLEKLGIEE